MANNDMTFWLPATDETNMSSTASSTPQPSDVPSPTPTKEDMPTPTGSPQKAPRRKPIPGRGFRKTRRGCFNCKRRHVKCSEHRPECVGCRRMSLQCVYPAPLVPTPRKIPSAPAVKVCLDHLRFFQHFLVEAYPPHPYGASAVWQDVAALSHEYEFLASSLLALAAQHLTVFNKADYSVQALGLRISAIKGLNDALSQPCRTAADADARYAAIISLTFQSSYMAEGLMDFVAMMRGWMIISTTLVTDSRASLFSRFTRQSFVESMEQLVKKQCTAEDEAAIEGFLASLRVLQPLLRGNAELQYLSKLQDLAVLSKTSPRDALLELVPCYALTNKMTDEEYASFTDPFNYGARILLAHFMMLNHMLEECVLSNTSRRYAFSKKITQSWILNIGRELPDGYQRYMIWPIGQAKDLAI